MLIVDTAGRLHVDEELMEELAQIRKRVKPHNVLLVVDAMTGQDAVNVAQRFAEKVNFDGVVMSKLDGDARGGAALSVRAVTGKPIMYASTGEKLGDFERFHPDRMAQRILGMGDVLTLVEKAEKEFDEDQAPSSSARSARAVHARRLPQADEAAAQDGAAPGDPEDDARASGSSSGDLQVDERELDRLAGDHHLDDARGAREPVDHQRLAPAPDRPRVGDQRAGRVTSWSSSSARCRS